MTVEYRQIEDERRNLAIILFQQTKILSKRTEEIQHVNEYRKM